MSKTDALAKAENALQKAENADGDTRQGWLNIADRWITIAIHAV